jgi:two-component system LytT family response regulator
MRALIVDDERLARSELRRLLRAHSAVEVVGEAAHVAEARAQIDALAPALLFLDIEMPGGSGFDLLAELESVPHVVFTTAYDEHAVRAFEVNALDYLLKPIEPARLAAAIERALASEARRSAPVDSSLPSLTLQRVFVRDGERCWFVSLDEVPVLAAEGNYARLLLPGQQPLVGRSLGYLEARLAPRFFRASRQHLVNLRLVERVEPGPGATLVLVMRGGAEIEMSRRQSQRFRELMSL